MGEEEAVLEEAEHSRAPRSYHLQHRTSNRQPISLSPRCSSQAWRTICQNIRSGTSSRRMGRFGLCSAHICRIVHLSSRTQDPGLLLAVWEDSVFGLLTYVALCIYQLQHTRERGSCGGGFAGKGCDCGVSSACTMGQTETYWYYG